MIQSIANILFLYTYIHTYIIVTIVAVNSNNFLEKMQNNKKKPKTKRLATFLQQQSAK